ncbi:helix-turn-helix domain-containing protein [Kineococcus terrestris]|uniref:helix-turn-helix domain-containing protein n=1 Tax=Kineococcus terrestris TaxID=2044856 RepID=UPI0034DB6212
MTPDAGGRQPRAVGTALRLLEEVARAGPGVSAAEVAESAGVPRATAYRLLNLLVAEEHLVRLPDLSGFALGARLGELARAAAPPVLPTAARDVLAAVRGRVRAAVHLFAVVETGGAAGRALRVADADPDLGLPVGERRLNRCLADSAAGRALLTGRPAGHEDGVAPGVRCWAVPVLAPPGAPVHGVVAVLAASAPTSGAHPPAGHAERLARAAGALAPLLA